MWEGKIWEILINALADAGCLIFFPSCKLNEVFVFLVLQSLIANIICWYWSEEVFMRAVTMKAPLCRLTPNNSIVAGFLINGKCNWGTIPAVLSGENKGKQGPLKLCGGPTHMSSCCLAAIPATGQIVSDVPVYLQVPELRCLKLVWNNCVSVFTQRINVFFPPYLTEDRFDLKQNTFVWWKRNNF